MSKLFLTRIFLLRVYDEKPPGKLLAVAQGIAVLLGLPELPRVLAQSSATDWERIVGGKAPFDVASVKRNVGSDGSNTSHSPTNSARSKAAAPPACTDEQLTLALFVSCESMVLGTST